MSNTKVLLATDFSPASELALRHAVAYARTSGARVLAVHVLSSPAKESGEGMLHSGVEVQDPKVLEQRLAKLAESFPGVEIETRLLKGDPAKEVLRLADEERVDLIALGTHGRKGVLRMLMGSVAEEIVRRAECPVLTVRQPRTANGNEAS